jgi:hypothetical protein
LGRNPNKSDALALTFAGGNVILELKKGNTTYSAIKKKYKNEIDDIV